MDGNAQASGRKEGPAGQQGQIHQQDVRYTPLPPFQNVDEVLGLQERGLLKPIASKYENLVAYVLDTNVVQVPER